MCIQIRSTVDPRRTLAYRAGMNAGISPIDPPLSERLRRIRFRAWHRGTREADYMVGGFFDTYHPHWREEELVWFEALLDEEDVDIMGWALGTIAVPARYAGAMMAALQRLDYVSIPR